MKITSVPVPIPVAGFSTHHLFCSYRRVSPASQHQEVCSSLSPALMFFDVLVLVLQTSQPLFTKPPDLARICCVSLECVRLGQHAWEVLRREAAVRIQSTWRLQLAVLRVARLRHLMFPDTLIGLPLMGGYVRSRIPADAPSLGIRHSVWVAYSAVSYQRLVQEDWWTHKERYQEYASKKLTFHGMNHAMHRFDVPGRGLLSALRVANRLTVEELACLGV